MDQYRTAVQVKTEFGAKPRRALVITTVVHESRAIQAHLVDIERIVGANGAIYEMGRFPDPAGDWYVIHALTQAGNSDASVVATKAHGEFGKFDLQMFVGVAGSLKGDIPIGSVVVGDYVYNSHSGKLDDKGYYSRPHSHTAAPELIKAAQILILDGDWVDLIKDPKRTKLPAADSYPCPFPPEAFIKGIASGEQVVAGGNSPAYQIIRQYLNDAGAVEMEGWGAMSAAHQEGTSAVIVRGISDMCDGKDHNSDAKFQPIASAHASAFAFAVLSLRSRASPLELNGSGLSPQPPEKENENPAIETRVEFVINFKGTSSDWPEVRIKHIVEGLQKMTCDPDLTLLRIDQGSIRLVVGVREQDLPALTLDAVRVAVGSAGRDLLGAVTAGELAEAEKAGEALKRASANLLSWEQTLPGGGWLERSEKENIESRFQSECSSTVLLGAPGAGKSALLAAIASDLIQMHGLVLAIKADLISTKVRSEQDLQTDLDLPALPGELIEKLARLQPVFLIIDQLDALASQLDLQSDRLNVLLNLVRRVGVLPNVHIVLSARTFEFNHDVRLKAIDAEAVFLELPAWHQVKEKLDAAGINADLWPENAREVVRNPQALKTYLSIAKVNDDETFSKYQAMLEQLWHQKIATAQNSEALASLASDIAGIMAEEETLWLAASRFDNRTRTLAELEAVGLIVRSENGQSIAFSHQTVFDYVLARAFVRKAGHLSTYVLERQNSLFVRAKLWSALRYLRDAEVTSYEREVAEIWRDKGLRRHLRVLLIEFMGELPDPLASEKVYFNEVMQSPETRIAGLKSIVGSPGWFANFAHSVLPAAMAGDDLEVRQVLNILQRAWTFDTEEVARLLRENWLPLPMKDGFTWAALNACVSWTDAVETIAHAVLSRTPINASQVDYTASLIAVDQPEVAFRLVRAKFDFLLETARAIPKGQPFPDTGTHEEQVKWHISEEPTKPFTAILESMEWNSLPDLGAAAPKKLIEALWPWFRGIVSDLKSLRDEVSNFVFPGLYSIDFGLEDDTPGHHTRDYPVLTSIRTAVEEIAKNDHSYFSSWAMSNGDLEYMAPQSLIAHGFSCAPEAYAQQAFTWIFDDLRRLHLGNSQAPRHTTFSLIRAVAPFWTVEQIAEFESRIQSYQPTPPAHIKEAEQRRSFSQLIRTAKVHLLTAIPPDQMSEDSQVLITMEKRALGKDLDQGTRFLGGGVIGSPMEASAMGKARDRDILKIFDEIPDTTDWGHPTKWMRGGNIQLSRAFAEFSKLDPTRALRIMEQFKPKAQERAAAYALDSLAETGGLDDELQEALLDLHRRGFGADEFRGSAASAVEKIANRRSTVSEPVVDILTEWLANPIRHIDPSGQESVSGIVDEVEEKPSKETRQESILWGHGGIGILPGGNFPILSALTSILLRLEINGRDRLIAILNEHLSREPDPKVWQALLIRLSNAGGSTPEVVSKFLRALFVRHPALLETREAIYFFAYAQRWDDAFVHDLIAPWGHAENSMLRQAHGELVGLVSFTPGSDRWIALREQVLESGSVEAKIGLAYACANLWSESQSHIAAGSLLKRLIPGANKKLMLAIWDVFRLCDNLISDPTTLELLKTLALPEVNLSGMPSTFLVEKLQSLLPHAAEIIGDLALKLVDAWRNELSDVRTETALAAPQLTDLAITLHRLGGTSRESGVTVFEALIDLDAYGARETLTEIDGRFGIHQTGGRRRVPRRASKRANRSAA